MRDKSENCHWFFREDDRAFFLLKVSDSCFGVLDIEKSLSIGIEFLISENVIVDAIVGVLIDW